jgi:hypothetical protein
MGAVLVGLGIGALLTLRKRRYTALAILCALGVIVAVGQRARIELERFANYSYFFNTADGKMLGKLPHDGASVQLEGYDASYEAQAEEALTYFAADEAAPGRVSIQTFNNPYAGLAYLTFNNKRVPAMTFDANYRYVLTRLAGVRTDRRMLARSGPDALEERTGPLDITPIGGIAVPVERIDRSGTAWVQPQSPLQLAITGFGGGSRVWAAVTLRATEPLVIPPQAGVGARRVGPLTSVCVRATGRQPLRVARLAVSAAPVAGPIPQGLFPPAVPSEAIALTSMRVATGHCSP